MTCVDVVFEQSGALGMGASSIDLKALMNERVVLRMH